MGRWEQVKKPFCYQKLFWPFTVWINCSGNLKNFANSRPSALNFKSFSGSQEQHCLIVGQNNFGNKIPFLPFDRVNIPWKRRKTLKKIFISLCSLILDLVHQSTLQRNERSTLEWLGDLKVTTLLLMQSLIYCALHAMGATILN